MVDDDGPVRFDYHAHSDYSDGAELEAMAGAAEASGLEAIGFADHCNVTDPALSSHEVYSLHETYEERRAELGDLRERFELRVFDAVELDYVPGEEARLRDFLTEADFEYSLGSVHRIDGVNVMHGPAVADADEGDRERLVDDYFDAVVALVESELVDVLSHLDVTTRNPHLREIPDSEHYERVAGALEDSRTVPELNLGRVQRAEGSLHPDPAFLNAFAERGVRFVVGTDAHRPAQVAARTRQLGDALDGVGVEVLDGLAPFVSDA
ncbi:MAG: PHP domain-containing protein [Haloferacaceae archaeon]